LEELRKQGEEYRKKLLDKSIDDSINIIMQQKGTIDKYIGDAIMAYWNAPKDVKNHAQIAVDTALEQLYYLKIINEQIKQNPKFDKLVKTFQQKQLPVLDIGIGINTGFAVVGEMGSTDRSDYTAIGDSVNLASRVESLCKYYNSKLNISNFTKDQLDQNRYIFRFLDLVMVKGKSEPVEIWQIIDYNKDKLGLYPYSKEELLNELEVYHNAIKFYKMAKFQDAMDILISLENYSHKSNKNIYKIYIDRCKYYIQNPPTNFNGVFQHLTKG
jgi:adenylate cyclase